MKFQQFIFSIALCLAFGCASSNSTHQHSFAIYLTASPVDARILGYYKGDWSQVKLSPTPVITDADILTYDFTTHSMTLTLEAIGRIPRPSVSGTPFVVVADGEKIYLGAFTTSISSIPTALPSIMVDRRWLYTNQPANILLIERGYPNDSFGVGKDPRSDKRIKTVLAALNKLEPRQ